MKITTDMEYFNDILCISFDDLTRNDAPDGEPNDAIMSESNYKKLAAGKNCKENINVVRKARGLGSYALIEASSLPSRFQQRVNQKYPNQGINMILRKWFDEHYYPDAEAREVYSKFRFDNGKPIPPETQAEYVINASVLGAVIALFNDRKMMKKSMGGRVKWDEMAEAVTYFKEKYEHTLPANPARFKERVQQFQSGGYGVLISKKFRNQNTRKVSVQTERLILSIAAQPTNPYNNTIHEQFTMFMAGEIDICDPKTGELFDREDFFDKKGQPLELSEATIWNYVNNPKNQLLLGKLRNTQWDFNNKYAPHHNRHSPFFSFSKISLDDRDLPRKAHSGLRPKAYYVYDVASGCVIGYAHSRTKDVDLFVDCVRNMFRTIEHNGWCIPAQAEVEHHLVNNFADGLMKAGIVFPFVRWCNPGNSQEKRAEHGNRAKKYGVEKDNHVGIGRWYNKKEVNRPKIDKEYDELNNTYKEKTFSYEELVADDIKDIYEYNNEKHPNTKLYPSMTRWQVLCDNMNPDLRPMDKAILCRFIGEHTQTTIRRTQYMQVANMKFVLSSPHVVEALASNDYKVDAYYLPDEEGNIDEVYIYQGGSYIDTCKPLGAYNEATCEQTEEDEAEYTEQSKYVAQFRKMVKDDKIQKVVIIPKEEKEALEAVVAKVVKVSAPVEQETEEEEYNPFLNADYMKSYARAAL